MQSKKILVSVCVLIILVTIFSSVINSASNSPEYLDEESGYRAIIVDDADLLDPAGEKEILEEMKNLTEFANIAIYTTKSKSGTKNELEKAKEKRIELFGKENSAVLIIDMHLRKIGIHRNGNMEEYFSNTTVNNITNNVAGMAHKGNYSGCCRSAIHQMLSVIQGEKVPEPMRHIGNLCISVALGILASFGIAIVTSTTFKRPSLASMTDRKSVV